MGTHETFDYVWAMDIGVIVYIIKECKYFKLRNRAWSFRYPLSNLKYKYYKYCNDDLYTISPLEYINDGFKHAMLHFKWSINDYPLFMSRIPNEQEQVFIPNRNRFLYQVSYENHILWNYDETSGVVFYRALRTRVCRVTTISLYLKDVSDREILLEFAVIGGIPVYLDFRQHPIAIVDYDSIMPISVVRMEPAIPVWVSIHLEFDLKSSPICSCHIKDTPNQKARLYITHPIATIYSVFNTQSKKLIFQSPNPFLIIYTVQGDFKSMQTLHYKDCSTVLKEYRFGSNGWFPIPSKNLSIIFTVNLDIDLEPDYRLYSKIEKEIYGQTSLVFTARGHVGFANIRQNGNILVHEKSTVPVLQFVKQDTKIHIVIQSIGRYQRWYNELGSTSWIKVPEAEHQFFQ
ncbi:hypothetical protein BdWA1_002604 [Babesia duncani]|uniref:Uncharacterized protein n=1 Tax=Babesia duncani TaxID=323732 RepID=A0AAD9PJJ1_9APIC|nr:hypothetical protein BdWA1_002604 [Babesia duncani]